MKISREALLRVLCVVLGSILGPEAAQRLAAITGIALNL